MTQSERETCLTMYGRGATTEDLAEHFDRHISTIKWLVRKRSAQRGHKFRCVRPKTPRAARDPAARRAWREKRYLEERP